MEAEGAAGGGAGAAAEEDELGCVAAGVSEVWEI